MELEGEFMHLSDQMENKPPEKGGGEKDLFL